MIVKRVSYKIARVVQGACTQHFLVAVLALVQHLMPTQAAQTFIYSDGWVVAGWMRGQ